MDFQVVKGDISQINVDAIVISVTRDLKCEGSLSKKIIEIENKDTKKKLLEENALYEPGTVVCIGAENLSAKYIFLAIVPKWIDGYHDEYLLLEKVYTNSLSLAENMKCKSIAFPILGIGKQNFNKDVAFERAKLSIERFSSNKLKKIILVDKRETVIAHIRDMGIQIDDKSEEKYDKKSLEQLFVDTNSLKDLNKEDLDEVFSTIKELYSIATAPLKYRTGYSPKTIVFQRTKNDYLIEKTKKHGCRITKTSSKESPVYCKEILLYSFLKNKVAEKRLLSSLGTKEYGLVLCGGGARGAYQIGACKALQEQTGICFTGIAGTSVGALNSLLIAQGDYKKAEEVWLKVTQNDLTDLNKLLKVLVSILGTLAQGFPYGLREKAYLPILILRLIYSGSTLFESKDEANKSQETFSLFKNKLGSIISNAIYNWESIDSDKIVYACSSTGFIKNLSHAVYFPLVDMSPEDITDAVMASAAYPIAYSKVNINGEKYNDGGVNNNVPYKVLVDNGFKNIIVIHLSRKDKDIKEYSANSYKSVKLHHIYPSDSLDDIFKIDQSLTERRMKMGYEDMRNWLNNVGNKF
jgi:NTE family protein